MVEGGCGIRNCEFCNVGGNVLEVCEGEVLFKELIVLLFVEDGWI